MSELKEPHFLLSAFGGLTFSTVHSTGYILDFKMSVDHCEPVNHKAGEWSFIPAGPDHDLVADPGKEVFYVWYEHFAREKDF